MRVRVKERQKGFIYGSLQTEGREFTLKPVEHSVDKDAKGEPLIISVDAQFSGQWMEKVQAKRGPKPRQDEE